MPRYYFDFNDTLAADVDGVYCERLEDAIWQACQALMDIAGERETTSEIQVLIRDDKRQVATVALALTVTLADAERPRKLG